MRFVPYVGSFIAAFFPLVLAVAIDPGWTMVWLTVARPWLTLQRV
jgi:predicted PurR-regulated permease PerM